MRLLICTQWFDPEPTPKGLSFARALKKRGLDVEVLTGFPNYPDGHVYDGFAIRAYQRETIDDVVVHRAWLYPSHDRSAVRRACNYLSFAAAASIAGLTRVRRPDVIYAYQLPTVGWACALLAARYGARLVLDVQDIWPDTVLSSGMLKGGVGARMLRAASGGIYRRADRVVALSHGMAALLETRGVPRSQIRVIHNWADEARIKPQTDKPVPEPSRALFGDGFSILFAGQMGEAQGLENALEAAALTPAIRWIFLGGGTHRARLEQMARDSGLSNVVFAARVPMSEVGSWLDAAGALLVHLSDHALYDATIPSKTQAYMLAGRPILMVARGDAARLVESAQAGVTCPPGDPHALAEAATRLAAKSPVERGALGANARAYYDRELAFDLGVNRFARVFQELVGDREVT